MLRSLPLVLGYFLCASARVIDSPHAKALHQRGPGDISIPVHSVQRDLQKRGQGSALTQVNAPFFSTAAFGSNAQVLTVWIDTGGSDLWCFHSGLSQAEQAGRVVYNASESTTVNLNPGLGDFSPLYSDGSYTGPGHYITDQVNLGGVTVPNFPMGIPKMIDPTVWFPSMSCNLGLASHATTPNSYRTFFDAALPQLTLPLFTAYLSTKNTGTYNFGYRDPKQYSGSITYTEVTGDAWSLSSTFIQVANYTAEGTHYAVKMDTGTAFVLLSKTLANAYNTRIPGFGEIIGKMEPYRWTVPCDAVMPDLYVTFADGATIMIIGDTLKYHTTPTTCCSLVDYDESELAKGLFILGAPVFESNWVEFSHEPYRVGFARSIDYASYHATK